MKEVSIIIPVYNVEKYVAECLNSVISQTYDHSKIECIIVDDCTPDHSMDIVNEIIGRYDGDMTFITCRHEHNLGLSAARNTGIETSSGEYLYFLDSDDHLFPETIHILMSATKNKTEELVIGNHYNEYEKILALQLSKIDSINTIDRIYFGKLRKLSVWNNLIKRSLLKKSQARFPIGIYFEDVIFNVKLYTFVDNAKVVPICTYFYRNNPTGIIRKESKEHISKTLSDYLYILTFLTDNLDKKICVGKNAIAVRIFFYIFDILRIERNTLSNKDEIGKRITSLSYTLIKYNLSHFRLFLFFHSLLTLRPIAKIILDNSFFRHNIDKIFNSFLFPALWTDKLHK